MPQRPLCRQVRPLTNLTEKQAELQQKVDIMSAQIQALRELMPEHLQSLASQAIDLTMVDVKSEEAEDENQWPAEAMHEILCAQAEQHYADRLMERFGTDDPDVLEADCITVDSE